MGPKIFQAEAQLAWLAPNSSCVSLISRRFVGIMSAIHMWTHEYETCQSVSELHI